MYLSWNTVADFSSFGASCALKRLRLVAWYAATVFVAPIGLCQTTATTQSLPIPPTATVSLLRWDVSARELLASTAAKSIGSSWRSLQADGMITMVSKDEGQIPAQLVLAGRSAARLDVKAASGMQTIILNGQGGTTGKKPLPAETAEVGLLQLQLVQGGAALDHFAGFVDQGDITVAGKTLRRMTGFLKLATKRRDSLAHSIDFYFDPETQLLVKSATQIKLPEGGAFEPLLVTTYSDYRDTGGVLFPYRISQVLDGQPQWDLAVTQITIGVSIEPSLFATR